VKLAAAALLVSWSLSLTAHANVERFAVIIGNNRGLADDVALQYAESDATRVFEVLRDLGGFQPADMVLLRGENADTVQRTLITVNDRIRAAVSLPDTRVMLFVYYSGHADADDLRLGPTRLPITQLAQLARGSAANFRLVVLDACRSGALTRLKGGKILPPFALETERLPDDGLAFLTASAANEDAQESDELRGSFFTHALVSGLLGAADQDGNGEVALEEAYRYAYDATIRATSRTFGGTQHPSFRYDFRGQGSIVLTRPEAYVQQRASLRFPPGMSFVLMRDSAEGTVVAELGERAPQRTLSLRPGSYFVRARGREVLYEGTVSAPEAVLTQLDVGKLSRIEYARLVRKGHNELQLTHSLEVGARVRSSLPNADSPCVGGYLGYAVDLANFGVRARLGACRAGFENARVSSTSLAYDLDLRLYRAWDLSAVALEVGLGGGATLMTQHFTADGIAPTQTSLVPFVALGVGGTVDLGLGWFAILDLAGETHFMRLRKDDRSPEQQDVGFALRASLGAGKHF
jgi:hypothetical protein